MASDDINKEMKDEEYAPYASSQSRKSSVDHPQHYRSGGIEAIDVIEAFGLGFNLGNVAKYVLRTGRKADALEDLMKARWYLDREIARMENDARYTKGGS